MIDYNTVRDIYNSRKYLLEILATRNFIVEDYNNFTFNELAIQYESNQLDLLLSDNNDKKIYVKYYIIKNLKSQNIYDLVNDLHNLEEILTKRDDLIIIINDEPNDTIKQTVKDIYIANGIYISVINIKRLQFNILNHVIVPKHTVLTNDEAIEVKKKYNILNDNQIPDISYFSPVSLVLGIRPGDLVKIDRKSKTTINTEFYRICKI
tara:strand:- start:1580 stop:2203 length:624 start_codon:yes stop_codon:yes gene_type:complete